MSLIMDWTPKSRTRTSMRSDRGAVSLINTSFILQDNKCAFSNTSIGTTETNYVEIPKGDEDALKTAVGTVGPVSVSITATDPLWMAWNGTGVYYNAECSPDQVGKTFCLSLDLSLGSVQKSVTATRGKEWGFRTRRGLT